MGIPGMIIGVPCFAVLYAFIRRHANKMLEKRGLPTETEKYLNVDYIEESNSFIPRNTEHKPKKFFKLGRRHKLPPSEFSNETDIQEEAGEQHRL